MAKFTKDQQKRLNEIATRTATVKPFMNDTPEKRAERIRKVTGSSKCEVRSAKGDWRAFDYFCKTYFPHIFDLESCEAHKDMFVVAEMIVNGVVGLTGFRGLGKTVRMAIAYPIWRIIRGDRYVVNTASTQPMAGVRTSFLHNELTNNERLLYDFPKLRTKDDDTDYFFLYNNTLIQALSISMQHAGLINPKTAKRPDLIICDDIDEEANMGNQSIGKRKMNKIIGNIKGSLKPGGGLVLWLGNLVHPNYGICQFEQLLINEIKAEYPDSKPEKRRHLFSGKKVLLKFGLENANGESRWPEQYPTVELPQLRRDYGPINYQREMLGRAIIEGDYFKATWFQRWVRLPGGYKRVWLYTDPASGEKNCFKSIEVMGNTEFHYYEIYNWLRQTSNNAYFRTLYETCQEMRAKYGMRFKPSIDASYGQTTLKDFDRWAKDHDKTAIGHWFVKVYLKENKHLRIEGTDTVIESGKLQFDPGHDHDMLLSQFLTYPKGFIDGPDCVAGCLERFEGYKHRGTKIRVRGFVHTVMGSRR
jgi:hypothetical protein